MPNPGNLIGYACIGLAFTNPPFDIPSFYKRPFPFHVMICPLDSHPLTWWIAFNAYGLLLFGGPIQLDTNGSGLLVDGWLRLRGWARIGVLVSRLRILLDEALRKRIDNPGVQTTNDGVINVVRRLVEFNGLDQ